MTDTEKDILRQLKATTAEELSALKAKGLERYSEMLIKTDKRIGKYVNSVIDAPDDHNLYELLGISRFFHLANKYQWRKNEVKAFFDFYELMRFSGVNGRQSYKLTPVQCFQFANIFGFADEQGRRLIRDAYLFVPRKFSKTTSTAALAVYDLLFGDNNAQSYVGANSFEQAKICFNEIEKIVKDIDPSMSYFRTNLQKIYCVRKDRESMCRCLTANAKTQDGLNASLVIMDEYSQARNTATCNGADLKNTLTSSMGARREPLTVIITTASEVIDGPFAQELEGVKAVLRGETENDHIFASLFMPDVDDREDDPHTWKKVQPHLGITVQKDYYAKEWEKAQLSAENMMTFRTKLLNIFAVNEDKCWIEPERIRDCMKQFSIDRPFKVKPLAMVAFDLSVHDDFSAVTYMMHNNQEKSFYAYTEYYFPAGAMETHPNRALYQQWVEDGHLILCDGDCIDVRRIANDILTHAKYLNIKLIGYDAYKAQDLVNILKNRGGKNAVVPVSQTRGAFNRPLETFEMLIYSYPSKIYFNDNPINSYCFANCVLDEDPVQGNKKPWKRTRNDKIDGAITALMALSLFYHTDK